MTQQVDVATQRFIEALATAEPDRGRIAAGAGVAVTTVAQVLDTDAARAPAPEPALSLAERDDRIRRLWLLGHRPAAIARAVGYAGGGSVYNRAQRLGLRGWGALSPVRADRDLALRGAWLGGVHAEEIAARLGYGDRGSVRKRALALGLPRRDRHGRLAQPACGASGATVPVDRAVRQCARENVIRWYWGAERLVDIGARLAVSRRVIQDTARQLGLPTAYAMRSRGWADEVPGADGGAAGAPACAREPVCDPPVSRVPIVNIGGDLRVRALWSAGWRTTDIATRLGYSARGAVSRRAKRLGLRGRGTSSPLRAQPAQESGPAVERVAAPCREPAAVADAPVDADSASEPGYPPAALTAPVLTVTHTAQGGCQWIAGEPAASDDCKCGRPTVRGTAYCAEHAARAYVRPGATPGAPARERV